MKKIFKICYFTLAITFFIVACKSDDYFVGGDLHNPNVNMSTYDFLKNNDRGLFDTLIMLVDKAGLKEKINQQGITFFAPTDYSIKSYLDARAVQAQKIDPFLKYTVDSLIKYDLPRFADSLNMYIIPSLFDYDDLTEDGVVFKSLNNEYDVVSYEETDDPDLGYNSNSGYYPQIMYFTHIFGLSGNAPVITPGETIDGIKTRVQTSGVISTTGHVNVLENGHILFFFGRY